MTKSDKEPRPQSDEKFAFNSSQPPRLNVGKTADSSDAPIKDAAPKK